MSLMKKVWDAVTKGEPKDDSKGKLYTQINSVEQGYNILAAVEAEQKTGKHDADVEISTAIESDLVKFLNYAVSLIPEKYALHKMLLVLRINPVYKKANGDGMYLSKKFIAHTLTKELKRLTLESEIDKIEKEAIRICQDAINKTRDEKIPILSA